PPPLYSNRVRRDRSDPIRVVLRYIIIDISSVAGRWGTDLWSYLVVACDVEDVHVPISRRRPLASPVLEPNECKRLPQHHGRCGELSTGLAAVEVGTQHGVQLRYVQGARAGAHRRGGDRSGGHGLAGGHGRGAGGRARADEL